MFYCLVVLVRLSVATPTSTITWQQSHFSHNNTEKYSQAHDACLAAVGRQVPRCQHWDAGSAEEVELSTANCLQRCLMADKWCYSDSAEPAGSFPLPKYTDNNSTSSYFKFTHASNVSWLVFNGAFGTTRLHCATGV